jgi:hypothetical protein
LKVIRKKNSKSEVRNKLEMRGKMVVNLRNKVKRITIEKLRLGEAKKKIENAGKRR